MEERKTKGKFERLRQALSRLVFRHAATINWWVGDKNSGAVLHDGNPQLRTLTLHSKDFLMVFFKNESKGTLDFGKNPPFWSFLIIIDAQIKARIKDQERRQPEKYARFMQYFKSNKDD